MLLGLQYEIGYNGRFSGDPRYDPLSVDDMIAAANSVGGRKVFWIGDSIIWGNGAFNITSPQLLEIELQARYGKDVHVFNAGLPAARTADKYAMLLEILATHPAMVIFELKYNEFTRAQVDAVVFRYPYLNDVVSNDPEYAAHYRDFINATPPLTPPRPATDADAERAAERAFSVVRFRGLIDAGLFGGEPFSRLSGAPVGVPPPPRPPSTRRGPDEAPNAPARLPENYRPSYLTGRFDSFPNAGLFFAERVAATLDAAGVPAITYFSALNHELLQDVAQGPTFDANVAMIDAIFSGHKFSYRNYHALLPSDDLFFDTQHLKALGDLAMVRQILADNGPLFDIALGSDR